MIYENWRYYTEVTELFMHGMFVNLLD